MIKFENVNVTILINGLIPHFVRDVSVDGTITVCGKNVAEMPMYEIAELVGSVFQNPRTQFFYTNSNAEMAFGLENRGVEPEYIRKRIKNTINELDIEKLEDRDVFSMSGGEKQLLAFASVYAMNPQIYVLDEPSANLDIAAMEKLSERMKVIKEKGHTVVVAEHRLAWIQKFADRIIYMKEGRIEQEFTSDEFKDLSDLKRKQMGLRSIVPAQIQIPEITGNSEDAVLQIYNLSCKRKKQMIFQNISLSARAGDIIGITGKNGAGKSTFCNCLCGLLKPKGGEILYQGKKLSEKDRTKLFGMVMQEVNHQLFSDSVKNECLLANEEVSEQEIRELLEKFDLEEYAEYHPMILSGGQRQRLAICQAVMGEKKLLIFDEPTSGLDFRHMCQVEKLMKQLSEEKYIIIVVTHDYEFLNRACKRYIRINS
ncbi:ABC transporter ATP-binding protein [Blautia wexlerae]|uniref:ABC transporter ATP-binding protein n=1 Tax=Blautia wexlerae TaxID=418240 RepID=UPI000E489E22|nr:ATP-binding cassette domain-containing protein [Ruminococcus sp. AM18-44]RHO24470.1 ATP-binding cassette domain-containing protein [Ruminococcus sp. AM18-15]